MPAANEEEGTEAVPAGSVDKNGDVIDDDGNKVSCLNSVDTTIKLMPLCRSEL